MRSTLWGVAVAIVCVSTASMVVVTAFRSPAVATVSSEPWTAYFGRHYDVAPWAASVRDVGHGAFGIEGNLAATPSVESSASLRALAAAHDVLLLAGGLGSGRSLDKATAYLRALNGDSGESWRRALTHRVVEIARATGGRAYWQVGNEINSAVFSRTMHVVLSGNKDPAADDPWLVPIYVEDFLAPAAQAIDSASQIVYGEKGRIPIVLGSIAGARRESARSWLRQLAEYRIRGRYAPGVAGQVATDLVDKIAIHYLVSWASPDWQRQLDELYGTYVGRGRVSGLWSTEEVGVQAGRRGRGAATTVQIMGRYLHWWLSRGLTPQQSRAFIYGAELGPVGSRGDDVGARLYRLWGDTPITDQTDRVNLEGGENHLEVFAFASSEHPSRLAVMVIPANERASKIRAVILTTAGLVGGERGWLYRYREGRTDSSAVAVRVGGGGNLRVDLTSVAGPEVTMMLVIGEP